MWAKSNFGTVNCAAGAACRLLAPGETQCATIKRILGGRELGSNKIVWVKCTREVKLTSDFSEYVYAFLSFSKFHKCLEKLLTTFTTVNEDSVGFY